MDQRAPIRVFTVDDHPLVREGIAAIIDGEADMTVVCQASNGKEAVQKYREFHPDVTLMDLRLPDVSGIDAMLAIRAETPGARIIILTTFEGDAEIHRSLHAGANGYLLKSAPPDDLAQAIRQVHAGKKCVPPDVAVQLAEYMGSENLSAREVEVLQQFAQGERNGEIARKLFISEDTVKTHLKHIVDKLGANDRTQAIAIAVRRGIIHL